MDELTSRGKHFFSSKERKEDKDVMMRENEIRISFDIPAHKHTILKVCCAQAHITIKDFMHEMVLKGIQELEEKRLQERVKLSIQQSKKGKVKSRGSFEKHSK